MSDNYDLSYALCLRPFVFLVVSGLMGMKFIVKTPGWERLKMCYFIELSCIALTRLDVVLGEVDR